MLVHDRRPGNHLQISPARQLQIEFGKVVEMRAELASRSAHAFRDRRGPALFKREQHVDAVRLSEVAMLEHDRRRAMGTVTVIGTMHGLA
jgi:hypothetical protein